MIIELEREIIMEPRILRKPRSKGSSIKESETMKPIRMAVGL